MSEVQVPIRSSNMTPGASHAWTCAIGATAGVCLGLLLLIAWHPGGFGAFPAVGFVTGAVVLPVLRHFFVSTSDTAGSMEYVPPGVPFEELLPASVEARSNAAVPYALATAAGSAITCGCGLLIAIVLPQTPFHWLIAGGFLGGALAGVAIHHANSGPTLPQESDVTEYRPAL